MSAQDHKELLTTPVGVKSPSLPMPSTLELKEPALAVLASDVGDTLYAAAVCSSFPDPNSVSKQHVCLLRSTLSSPASPTDSRKVEVCVVEVPIPLATSLTKERLQALNTSTESAGSLNLSVLPDPARCQMSVVDVQFYDQTQLAVLLRFAPAGPGSRVGVHSHIAFLNFSSLSFSPVPLTSKRPSQGGSSLAWKGTDSARPHLVSYAESALSAGSLDIHRPEEFDKEREILHMHGLSVALCPQRGLGAVMGRNRKVLLLDMNYDDVEDSDDESSDDEEDNDDNNEEEDDKQ